MSDIQAEEESPARRRVRVSCGNRDHARLLLWHDMWARTVHEADDTREKQREQIDALRARIASLEAENRYLRMSGAERGTDAVTARYEALVAQSGERERGWREEFEHVRDDRNEQADRALRAEELVEQGLLREHQLIGFIAMLLDGPAIFLLDEDMIRCAVCGGHTTKRPPHSAEVEHFRDCTAKRAREYVRRWNEEGGVARSLVAGELANLKRAAIELGLDRLGTCPSCGAERTNGEWHGEDCSLVPILEQMERQRDRK